MPRIVTRPNASNFSPEDIDRYEDYFLHYSKRIEVQTLLTDIEKVDETLEKLFNEQPPENCGYWRDVESALLDRGNMIEVFLILRRVRLLPDKEGKVNFIKWSKEQ